MSECRRVGVSGANVARRHSNTPTRRHLATRRRSGGSERGSGSYMGGAERGSGSVDLGAIWELSASSGRRSGESEGGSGSCGSAECRSVEVSSANTGLLNVACRVSTCRVSTCPVSSVDVSECRCVDVSKCRVSTCRRVEGSGANVARRHSDTSTRRHLARGPSTLRHPDTKLGVIWELRT